MKSVKKKVANKAAEQRAGDEKAAKRTLKLVKEKPNRLLNGRLAHLQKLRAGGERTDTRYRYEVGVPVSETKAKDGAAKYGDKAVEKIAKGLDLDASTVYPYAFLPERWSKQEFAGLIKRKGKNGRTLTASHLLLLAKVSDAAMLQNLISEVLKDGLSVSKLERKIGGTSKAAEGTEPSKDSDPLSLTNDLAMGAKSSIEELKTWKRDVLDSIKDNLDQAQRASLESAKAAFGDLVSTAGNIIDDIDEVLSAADKTAVPLAAPVTTHVANPVTAPQLMVGVAGN